MNHNGQSLQIEWNEAATVPAECHRNVSNMPRLCANYVKTKNSTAIRVINYYIYNIVFYLHLEYNCLTRYVRL